MRIKRQLVALFGIVAMLGIGSVATAQDSATAVKAKIGEKAPAFTLTDAKGKEHKLEDYKGKIVVMQWINPDCPVCRRVVTSGLVAEMKTELKKINEKEIVYIAINSTHYQAADVGAEYFKKHELKANAILNDMDGKVGKMYGAKTTPHMFVIDKEGVLRYEGAFDNDGRGRNANRTNYVVAAVQAIEAGETVAPERTKAYGCSVKYAR